MSNYDKEGARAVLALKYDLENQDMLKVLNELSLQGDTVLVELILVSEVLNNYDEALVNASSRGYLQAVKVLLGEVADVHSIDDYALILACYFGHLEVVNVLLKAGVNVHAEGEYALSVAIENGDKEMVKMLLEAGADVKACDKAIAKAIDAGYKEIELLLLEHMKKV